MSLLSPNEKQQIREAEVAEKPVTIQAGDIEHQREREKVRRLAGLLLPTPRLLV